jgi:septal ring factor EnvC (AmiA/AmiB activator)
LSQIQNTIMNKIVIIISIIFISISAFAQNKEQLEKKREELLKDIKYTQDLLKSTKANKQISIADLNAINKQIELRQSLINNTQSQVNLFGNQIVQQKNVVEQKSAELNQLKKEYAEAISKTYQYNKFANKLLFIADAKSFSEALKRFNYLQKYAKAREKQAQEIISKSKEIQSNIQLINVKKAEKEKLLSNQLTEKKDLSKSQQIKNKMVFDLKIEESKLQKTLANKKAEANKLNNQISAIIKKEIEEAKKKAASEAAAKKAALEKEKLSSNKTTTSKEIPEKVNTTPEYDKLTSNFLGNKGKLPWPVEKGFISKDFGKYNHPDLPGVLIENNGIDIRTDPNATVRTVFEGTVVGILNNPVFKNAVIISHGEYFTVYSKLESVNVAKGQKLSTKQSIGKVYTDTDNQTEVHLEVWKGSEKINPAYWIYKK